MASTSSPDMEDMLHALGERVRLRILSLIGDTELCVCFFVEALELPQPTISRHLGFLRRRGVVTARRDGLWMHYRIVPPADPHVTKVLRATLEWCAQEPEMRRDRQRLSKACCAPESLSGW
ncbi:MAG: ArsR/SmtB family transcription factor [Chthoniobacterales bacterium]